MALDEMRLVKDAHEIATMRRAASISAGAHVRAMRATRPGAMEYEVEAELLYEFRRHGAQFPAYWPIVAGGANACVLHYRDNSQRLADGDLLLIDAGCELDGYAADITRTFPVNGKFSGPQRDVYDLVLASQAAAIEAVRPGHGWNAPHASFIAIGGGDVARDEMLAARQMGKHVIFIPADMNHKIAREKAQKEGQAEPTDFRGSAHGALAKCN